jgi:hypothetical protein
MMGIHNIAQLINKQDEVVIQPDADDGDTIVRGED